MRLKKLRVKVEDPEYWDEKLGPHLAANERHEGVSVCLCVCVCVHARARAFMYTGAIKRFLTEVKI